MQLKQGDIIYNTFSKGYREYPVVRVGKKGRYAEKILLKSTSSPYQNFWTSMEKIINANWQIKVKEDDNGKRDSI